MRCAALATTSFRKPNIRFHNSDHGDDDEDNDYDDGGDDDHPQQRNNGSDVATLHIWQPNGSSCKLAK